MTVEIATVWETIPSMPWRRNRINSKYSLMRLMAQVDEELAPGMRLHYVDSESETSRLEEMDVFRVKAECSSVTARLGCYRPAEETTASLEALFHRFRENKDSRRLKEPKNLPDLLYPPLYLSFTKISSGLTARGAGSRRNGLFETQGLSQQHMKASMWSRRSG